MALSIVCNTYDLNQKDRCVLNIDGKNVVLYLKLHWRRKIQKWLLSVFSEDGEAIIRNLPMVGGASFPSCDLLRQFEYMGIGHASCLPTVADPTTPNPYFNNLGNGEEWVLVWGLPDE